MGKWRSGLRWFFHYHKWQLHFGEEFHAAFLQTKCHQFIPHMVTCALTGNDTIFINDFALNVAYVIRMSFCWAIEFLITFLKTTSKIVQGTKIWCSLDEFFVALRTSEKNYCHELFTAPSAKYRNDLRKKLFLSSGRIRFYFSFLLNSFWTSWL